MSANIESSVYNLSEWLYYTFFLLVYVVTIVPNGLVLIVLRRKQLKSTTFELIANQTVSEIMFCLVSIGCYVFCTKGLVDYSKSMLTLCHLINTVKDGNQIMTTFSILVIAYDRYRKLYRPLSAELNTRGLITVMWLVATGLLGLLQHKQG